MITLRNQKGFTLLEVFAAIVVFALGILALYRLQAATVQSNVFANELTLASSLAQDRLERLLTLAYDDPGLNDVDNDGTNQDNNGDGVDDNGGNFGLDDTVDAANNVNADGSAVNGRYSLYWNVAVDQPVANNRTIRVIATWNDGKNRPHRVVLNCTKTNIP